MGTNDDDKRDAIAQCVQVSLDNHAHGKPGTAPTATLYEIVDAVRAHKDPEPVNGSRTIRLMPDPRLIAAVIACRDYDGQEQGGGLDAIVVMKCPRSGRTKALVCVFVPDPTEEDADDVV